MILKITAKEFSDAKYKLFNIYGVTSTEIIDFTDNDDGTYEFEVEDTTQRKCDTNKLIDKLIKTNSFRTSHTSFICDDGKVYTPTGPTLFDRIKVLLVTHSVVPLAGFDGFIDASNLLHELLTSGSLVVGDLILSKEGDLLKNRLVNSKFDNSLSIRIEFKPKDKFELMILMDAIQDLEGKVSYSIIKE